MGWKNVKEHYRIVHQVQVTDAGICIGSPYIDDIIVVTMDGGIIRPSGLGINADLVRYQREMKADLAKLRELIETPDTFERSITVYTYHRSEIIEKQCEELGWPNVTHDGLMMYENTFSADRDYIVERAKANALARIEIYRERLVEAQETVAKWRKRLAEAEADAVALGVVVPDAPPTPQAHVKAASFSEIREALRDETIASYPDFVAAVTSAIDELASRRKARTYEAGRADGHAEAINQAAGAAYRVCAETRHVTLGESAARAIRALDPPPQPREATP